MARIVYNAGAPAGGWHLANAVKFVILAQQEIARAMNVANSLTGGGVTPANLEGSAEFGAGVGAGTTLYTAANNLRTNLASITASAIGDLDGGNG